MSENANLFKQHRKLFFFILAAVFTVAAVILGIFLLRPSIKLASDGDINIEAGTEFDPQSIIVLKNAAWSDVIFDGNVDTANPGSYSVSYTLNKSVIPVLVNVVDTTPPVLTLTGNSFHIFEGDTLTVDDIVKSASDLTGATCRLDDSRVSLAVPGTYKLNVVAVDAAGNEKSMPITVVVEEKDVLPPVITGAGNCTVSVGHSFDPMAGVSVTDDKDPKPTITVDDSAVNMMVRGTFTVTYTATDASGNTTTVVRTVTVGPDKSDNSGPVISGAESVTISLGSSFDIMAGISAKDNKDPKPAISASRSSLDTRMAGTFTITYTATDMSGNTTSVNRTITIPPQTVSYDGGTFTAYWSTAGDANQPYLVTVNRSFNTVTVYGKDSQGNYTVPVRAAACSVGRRGNTPVGYHRTSDRYRWATLNGGVHGQYAIRVIDGFLFHSVPYYTESVSDLEYLEYNKLGTAASAGCIRLTVEDAKWLYNNCPNGFTTVIYDDTASAGPLGKPSTVTIDPDNEAKRGWDPTDPDPANPWHSA